MNKLVTPLLFVFAIATAVGLWGWRGAARTASTAGADLTAATNKVAELTAKLAEQGAVAETLRTQLGLLKTDLSDAGGKNAQLQSQLNERNDRLKALNEEIAGRVAQVAALNRTNLQQAANAVALNDRVKELEGMLDSVRKSLDHANEKLEATRSDLNRAEAEQAGLLAKLSDPSVLRAQLRTLTTPQAARHASAEAKLTLNPDGTVLVGPISERAPHASEHQSSQPSGPIFSDPPVDEGSAPNIRLN